MNVTEAGCLGAAMLARSADVKTPVENLAAEMVRAGWTVQPSPECFDYYTSRFAAYKKMYPALKSLGL